MTKDWRQEKFFKRLQAEIENIWKGQRLRQEIKGRD